MQVARQIPMFIAPMSTRTVSCLDYLTGRFAGCLDPVAAAGGPSLSPSASHIDACKLTHFQHNKKADEHGAECVLVFRVAEPHLACYRCACCVCCARPTWWVSKGARGSSPLSGLSTGQLRTRIEYARCSQSVATAACWTGIKWRNRVASRCVQGRL